eukprot:2304576-Pleurochrysis_carterae.AAC.1
MARARSSPVRRGAPPSPPEVARACRQGSAVAPRPSRRSCLVPRPDRRQPPLPGLRATQARPALAPRAARVRARAYPVERVCRLRPPCALDR